MLTPEERDEEYDEYYDGFGEEDQEAKDRQTDIDHLNQWIEKGSYL